MMNMINELGIVELHEEGVFRHIHPSQKVDGNWIDTDLSGETEEVRDFCELNFTDDIKTAYQEHIDTNLVV
mgnify:FL=1|tara:strand:+ start:921 stop:1133 length:213 start_codon:yes stop_codon:yes gene_type:complete